MTAPGPGPTASWRRLPRAPLGAAGRYLLVLAVSLLAAALLARTPMHAQISRWTSDAVQGLTAERVRFEDVLVVDIDESAMAALEPVLGAWPYARGVYAEVLDHLMAAGARAVVFDVLMVEQREGDDALAAALSRHERTWLAARGQPFALDRGAAYFERLDRHAWQVPDALPRGRWQDILLPTEALDGTAGVGVISVEPDDDGVLRRVQLLHEAHGRVLPALAAAALSRPGERPVVAGGPGWRSVGGRRWPVDARGQVILRVPRNRDFLRVVGFDRVLAAARGDARSRLDPAQVAGRTVFIGSSAAVLGDYARLPILGRTAGLGTLALAFAGLAHDYLLRPQVMWLDLLLVVLAAALPLLLTNRRGCPELVIVACGALGIAAALTVHVAAFGWLQRISDAAFAVAAGVMVMLLQVGLRFRALHEERRRLWLEKRAADEANALKSRFLAHMTHELRTPLTAIMGYNRLLAEPGVTDAQRAERTAVVERNGEHLLALINNLLDQAKIEAGQMTVEREPVVVRALLEDCRATLAPLAGAKGLALGFACDATVPAVLELDPLRLRQILLNLAGNAVKFTATGSVQVTLAWSAGVLEAEVRDTGPGMSADALGRIFEAFQQADATVTRSHGGTGLGLTISRNLARMMGGDIRVDSTPGHGTCFTVRLDAAPAPAPGPAPAAQAGHAGAPDAIAGRVLLADDTEDIRELVSLQLTRLGVDVTTARDGREALELALASAPDLVLMDMEMPRMNGLEATAALREAGFTGRVLALTAHGDEAHRRAAGQAGCDGVLVKPVSRGRLAEAMREHLGGR